MRLKFADARGRYMERIRPLAATAREKGPERSRRQAISKYLGELKKHAETKSQHDCFSDSRLFTRREIEEPRDGEEAELIRAILALLRSEEYATVVDEMVGRERLVALLRAVTEAAGQKVLEAEAVRATNRATSAVKASLNQSAVDPYPEQVLFGAFEDEAFERAFARLVETCWREAVVATDGGRHFGKYHLVAERKKYSRAVDVKKNLGCSENLGGIVRRGARDYVETLLELDSIADITDGLFDLQVGPRDGKGRDSRAGRGRSASSSPGLPRHVARESS